MHSYDHSESEPELTELIISLGRRAQGGVHLPGVQLAGAVELVDVGLGESYLTLLVEVDVTLLVAVTGRLGSTAAGRRVVRVTRGRVRRVAGSAVGRRRRVRRV